MQSLFNVYKNWKFTFKIFPFVLVVKGLDSKSRVPLSNLLGGFKIKVISAFYPVEVDQMSTRNLCTLSGKKNELSPRSGFTALRQLNLIQKRGLKVLSFSYKICFLFFTNNKGIFRTQSNIYDGTFFAKVPGC